jgi:hypothetical protein
MKRISSYLFALMAFASLNFLTGCGEDPEPPTTPLPEPDGTVKIEFTNFPGADPSVNVATDDIVTVSIRMIKDDNGTRPQKLRIYETATLGTRGTQVKIEGMGDNSGTIDLRNVDDQTKTVDYKVPMSASNPTYLYFEVDESNDKFSRKVLKLNVGSGSIASWTSKELGAQTNTKGSRIASTTGDIYTVCDVPENIKYIDITYASLTIGGATLLSNPQRATEGLATTTSNSPCPNPTGTGSNVNVSTAGGRATYFASSTANFDTADETILNGLAITASAPQKISVSNGGTYAFLNSDGKKGLVKVTSLTNGTSGSIVLSIKVQR